VLTSFSTVNFNFATAQNCDQLHSNIALWSVVNYKLFIVTDNALVPIWSVVQGL